jgi:RNA polymerase sigma-70 factor (ECF subfamily)
MYQNSDCDPSLSLRDVDYLDGLYSYAMILTGDHQEAKTLVFHAYTQAAEELADTSTWGERKREHFRCLRKIWLESSEGLRETDSDVLNTKKQRPYSAQDDHGISRIPGDGGSGTKHLRAAIHALPLSLGEIIILREHEEFSYQEIATVMRSSVETVAAELITARSDLKSHLDSDPGFFQSWSQK